MTLYLYDTTLRDGTQREGLSLSVDDKVKIARRLDAWGSITSRAAGRGRTPRTLNSSAGFARSRCVTPRSRPSG